MDPANWNVLHDGHVTAADGTVPSDLRLSIQIDYLCRYLPAQSDDVIITLIDCQQFEYHPYQQPSMSNVAAIAALNLELLSAQIDNGCISVECADGGYGGRLILRYRSANATTVEGRALTQPELESAAEHYWSDWGQSHK